MSGETYRITRPNTELTKLFAVQSLNINSASATLTAPWVMIGFTALRIQAVLNSGSWGSAELEVLHSLDATNWTVVPSSTVIDAEEMTDIIYLPCCMYATVRVKTVAGGAGVANIYGYADSSYAVQVAEDAGERLYTSVTSTYTTTASDRVILASGTFTITLVAAASATYKTLEIKNIGTGTVTVDANGSETIDASASAQTLSAKDAITLYSDGSGWWIL